MRRMAASNVFLYGLGGLGVEIGICSFLCQRVRDWLTDFVLCSKEYHFSWSQGRWHTAPVIVKFLPWLLNYCTFSRWRCVTFHLPLWWISHHSSSSGKMMSPWQPIGKTVSSVEHKVWMAANNTCIVFEGRGGGGRFRSFLMNVTYSISLLIYNCAAPPVDLWLCLHNIIVSW